MQNLQERRYSRGVRVLQGLPWSTEKASQFSFQPFCPSVPLQKKENTRSLTHSHVKFKAFRDQILLSLLSTVRTHSHSPQRFHPDVDSVLDVLQERQRLFLNDVLDCETSLVCVVGESESSGRATTLRSCNEVGPRTRSRETDYVCKPQNTLNPLKKKRSRRKVSHTLRYSTRRWRKRTKCSALRMLPGTASV